MFAAVPVAAHLYLQRTKMDAHPMFERVSDEELESDPAAGLLTQASEEGQKVARNQGRTWRNVYRRLEQPRQLTANPEKLASRR
jgi:tRNA (guanine-N7-)-methyltransferase